MQELIRAARASVAAAFFLGQAAAFGQTATDLIRTHVEELRVSGRLEVLGEPIASRTVLPHVYENRKFAPAWESLRHVDDLLKMIDESYLEGLDPSDYHATALHAFRATVTDLNASAPADRAAFRQDLSR